MATKFSFNSKLLFLVGLIALILAVRLWLEADLTGNWKGFWYSILHIVLVGSGTYLAIREHGANPVKPAMERSSSNRR